MTIDPATNSPREISVIKPISPALEHVKQMLFKPFDLGKWFTIGFCAWLAGLGESGFSFNGNFGNGGGHKNYGRPEESFQQLYDHARNFTMNNLYWIVPVAALLILFCLGLWVLLLWLNSRGKFMFLHCVALNKAEVAVPWNKFKGGANSLFRFRIVLGLGSMIVTLPLLALIAISIIGMCLRGKPDVPGIMTVIGFAFVFFLVAMACVIIQKLMVDFVVPIMFLRGGKCLDAWKNFYDLLCVHAGQFALYILFQIVISMAIATIVLFVILLTCCIAGCLMLIPYIGTVLLLPVLIFKRAYSLYFLQQFGMEYDVFPSTPPVPPLI